jgi:X-X-X-Leu-X-X-Gly heptad repeat protein
MSHAARRPLTAAVVATCSLALIGAPAAGAKSKVSRTDRTQSAAIKKQGTAIKKVTRTANSANRTARSADRSAAAGLAAAAAASRKADGAQGGVNAVLAGVPQITDGLRQLATGLQQAATGLTQLKDGLTTVGNALAAQEYGAVYVQIAGQDVPGTLLNSADIPDDSNAAIVTGTVLVPVPAAISTATPVKLLAGVRSGESDGTGADNPVASAGIVSMSVADTSGGGVTVGGGNTGLAGAPITSAPNTPLGGAPVYNIPLKAPRVDATPNPFAFPDADAIDLTDPSTLYNLTGAGVGPFTVRNNTAGTLPVTVTFTVRFNDLTASATDVTA